jgi:hypothetical protein
MEARDLQELRGDLHDLYDAIGSLGIELEAMNMSVRALTAHLTGEDPLKDSLYYGGEQDGDRDLHPPEWVNQASTADEGPADPWIKSGPRLSTKSGKPGSVRRRLVVAMHWACSSS